MTWFLWPMKWQIAINDPCSPPKQLSACAWYGQGERLEVWHRPLERASHDLLRSGDSRAAIHYIGRVEKEDYSHPSLQCLRAFAALKLYGILPGLLGCSSPLGCKVTCVHMQAKTREEGVGKAICLLLAFLL